MDNKNLILSKEEKIALIYGILLGDGCLSKVGIKHYFISIVGHLKDDLAFFEKVIVPILETLTNRKIKIRKRIKQRKLEILFTNKEFFNFLNNLGFPIGKKGINLEIPNFFNNKFKFIIQGYFATDGSLVLANNNGTIYPRIEFTSISKKILLQTLKYLIQIGMKGYLYKFPKSNNITWNERYRIQFNGRKNLEIFKEKIGFCNFKQNKKYKNYKKCAAGET